MNYTYKLTTRGLCSELNSVLSRPPMTIPSESPTKIVSTPASSAIRAMVASYAVTMVMGCC